MINDIVIVGGGTAGWLCAGILAAEYRDRGVATRHITLVESPDVSAIGVGEGTWPTMRTTLHRIGLSETDFINSCNASFKQGSKFVGWKDGSPQDAYYHPFSVPAGFSDTNVYEAWRQFYSDRPFDETVNIQSRVCEKSLAPKQVATPEFASALNYGYHLDAGKFSDLLMRHCTENLGVKHVRDHVVSIDGDEQGYICGLKTTHNGDIAGQFFIDCTGSHSLLIGKHYQIPFVDCRRYSMNDRALAVQVPYAQEGSPIASATIATAQSAGWTWDIGLSSRRGVGYVYSSDHIEGSKAENELMDYLRLSVDEKKLADLGVRQISINPGYREKFWHKNCVAIGMSAGFIEPLEASALALVELSAAMLRDELPNNFEEMAVVEKKFNKIFHYRWQRIIEFLKLHYMLSQRRDSEYWRDAVDKVNIPEGLLGMMAVWKSRPPYVRDFLQTEEIFPYVSYMYVLYGMGFSQVHRANIRPSFNLDKAHGLFAEEDKKLQQYLSLLPTNRQLLDEIKKHGLRREQRL